MPESLNTAEDTSLNDLFESFKFKTVLNYWKKEESEKACGSFKPKDVSYHRKPYGIAGLWQAHRRSDRTFGKRLCAP